MEFIMSLSEYWNECLVLGIVSGSLVFLFVGIAMYLAKAKKQISATILSLLGITSAGVCRLSLIISAILLLCKIVLNII